MKSALTDCTLCIILNNTKGGGAVLLQFDFSSPIPLYIQLRNQIVIGIAEGKLQYGEHLPQVRALADESGVNAMTVSKAYQLLRQEGYITTDRRRGAVVCWKKGTGRIPERTKDALRLHLAELRLAGLDEQEALALCSQLYKEGLL